MPRRRGGGGPQAADGNGGATGRVVIGCADRTTAERLAEAVRRAGLEPVLTGSARAAVMALQREDVRALLAEETAGPGGAAPDEEPQELRWGPLHVDLRVRAASWCDRPVPTTPAQFDLLVALVRHRGAAVRADDLATLLYGSALTSDQGRIRAHVKRLRRRLRAAGDPAPGVIVTMRGYGYRLGGAVDGTARPGTPGPG